MAWKIPFTDLHLVRSTNNNAKNNFESGNWYDVNPTKSGVIITKENANQQSGVYAAVLAYANAIASLPIHIIKETKNSKQKDLTHPLYSLLSKEPNKLMTSFVWRQIVMSDYWYYGNSFNYIEFQGGGSRRPIGILPIPAKSLQEAKIIKGIIHYKFMLDDGTELLLDQSQLLHFRGVGDNILGKSVVDIAKNSLGLGKAAEEYGSNFFSNGGTPSGVLYTDSPLGDKAYENITKSWQKSHGGLNKAQKVAILEQGLKYQAISTPPEVAQFLETRQFGITEQARWFNLPPHVLRDLTRATFSNIEQQDLDLVKHSFMPIIINMEQEIDRKLFREQEKSSTYVKMNIDGLLRADIKTRVESYASGIQNGWMTPNEARSKEGMNNMEGLDTTWMQINTAPVIDGTNQQDKQKT